MACAPNHRLQVCHLDFTILRQQESLDGDSQASNLYYLQTPPPLYPEVQLEAMGQWRSSMCLSYMKRSSYFCSELTNNGSFIYSELTNCKVVNRFSVIRLSCLQKLIRSPATFPNNSLKVRTNGSARRDAAAPKPKSTIRPFNYVFLSMFPLLLS